MMNARAVRRDLARMADTLRYDLEEIKRRRAQGFPANTTASAFRGLAANVMKAIELAGQLSGADAADSMDPTNEA
jgi:hypothetical protein